MTRLAAICRLAAVVLLWLLPAVAGAQQYNGTTGLLHVPSANMGREGDARIGMHYLHKCFTPDTGFLFGGQKYDTYDYYLGITPYRWLEISYACTKRKITRPVSGDTVYGAKDRYFSVKIQPVSEGRYRPALAIGCNDIGTTVFRKDRSDAQLYFSNVYLAASKHVAVGGSLLGVNIAYRHYFRAYNDKWNGLVGGLTFSPAFLPQARAVVEYTGDALLIGADALICKHILLQACLQDFKYCTFGVCLRLNMLRERMPQNNTLPSLHYR